MAVNNTVSVKEYKLTGVGSLRLFPITFEYTTDSSGNAENIHCQFATKGDDGTYSYSEEIAQGMGTDQFQIDHGNVKYIDDESNFGQNNYIVIYRSTPPSQLTDFIDNGSYSLEDIEKALDKLTFLIQERTGTPVGTYINIGVSLFFANLLQLVSKKDALETLFTWTDIPDADKPVLAGKIRGTLDAVSRTLANTFEAVNTFNYSPLVPNLTGASSNNASANKKYVDDNFSTLNAKFPVATSDIADGSVTNAKIGDGAVTWAKIYDGSITYEKIYDNNVTWNKLNKGSVSVHYSSWDSQSQLYRFYWSNGGNKIPYALSDGANGNWSFSGGNIYLAFTHASKKDITVYYIGG